MEKRDFILNDFLGVSDQYGTVQVNSSTTSYLGRVVHYRLNRDIVFAYSVELSGGMQGYSAGGYNAYQPSLNTEDSEYLVSNWVTIINLSSQIQGFQLERYLSDGSEVVDEVYFLPPMGRADIEGGHLVGGGAGINTVQPLDPSVRYLSYTTRYGDIGTEITGGVTGYYFASSSLMMQPEARKHFLSVGNEVTWLEISNISSSLEEILLEVLALDGTQLFRETFGLPGKTQRHFDVSSVLGAYESGYVKMVTASGHKVVLQSATYEELDTGSIGAMNVSVAADVYGRLVNGAFNTFYDSTNKLRLTNISSDFQDVTITSSYFETIRTRLAPDATEVVDLTFVSDAYGEITVESTTSGSVMAELVRRGNGEFLISSRGR